MKINKKYGVRVPATTANIGSGFDTLGMALGLYNEAYFTPVNELSLMKSHICLLYTSPSPRDCS